MKRYGASWGHTEEYDKDYDLTWKECWYTDIGFGKYGYWE